MGGECILAMFSLIAHDGYDFRAMPTHFSLIVALADSWLPMPKRILASMTDIVGDNGGRNDRASPKQNDTARARPRPYIPRAAPLPRSSVLEALEGPPLRSAGSGSDCNDAKHANALSARP